MRHPVIPSCKSSSTSSKGFSGACVARLPHPSPRRRTCYSEYPCNPPCSRSSTPTISTRAARSCSTPPSKMYGLRSSRTKRRPKKTHVHSAGITTLLAWRPQREAAMRRASSIRKSPQWRIVHVTEVHMRAGEALYASRCPTNNTFRVDQPAVCSCPGSSTR